MSDKKEKRTAFEGVDPTRRRVMQAIRSKDTKPEVLLRKALWHRGYRYRKNYKRLPGSPDIYLSKYKLCIFIDSEFFHGKEYKNLVERLKKGKRADYWVNKINKNVQRDAENEAELHGNGYQVLRFWGNDVIKNLEICVRTVEETIFDITVTQM